MMQKTYTRPKKSQIPSAEMTKRINAGLWKQMVKSLAHGQHTHQAIMAKTNRVYFRRIAATAFERTAQQNGISKKRVVDLIDIIMKRRQTLYKRNGVNITKQQLENDPVLIKNARELKILFPTQIQLDTFLHELDKVQNELSIE